MKFFLPFIILASVLIVGCSKKNDNAPSSNFVGKWYLVTDSTAQYTNGSLAGHSKITVNHQGYLQFNADGTGLDDVIQQTSNGDNVALDVYEIFTYAANGNNISFSIPTQIVGTQQIQANNLTATVQSHTNNGLTIVFDNSQSINGSVFREVEVQTYSK